MVNASFKGFKGLLQHIAMYFVLNCMLCHRAYIAESSLHDKYFASRAQYIILSKWQRLAITHNNMYALLFYNTVISIENFKYIYVYILYYIIILYVYKFSV